MTAAHPVLPLAEELARLKEFLGVLREEEAALVQGAVDTLMAVVERKSALALRLGAYAKQREEALAAHGLPAARVGMEAWLAQAADGVKQRAFWDELIALAADARVLNETNGKLIALRMGSNQQVMTALMAATDQAMTYGPDGQQRGGGSGRFLGSA